MLAHQPYENVCAPRNAMFTGPRRGRRGSQDVKLLWLRTKAPVMRCGTFRSIATSINPSMLPYARRNANNKLALTLCQGN